MQRIKLGIFSRRPRRLLLAARAVGRLEHLGSVRLLRALCAVFVHFSGCNRLWWSLGQPVECVCVCGSTDRTFFVLAHPVPTSLLLYLGR